MSFPGLDMLHFKILPLNFALLGYQLIGVHPPDFSACLEVASGSAAITVQWKGNLVQLLGLAVASWRPPGMYPVVLGENMQCQGLNEVTAQENAVCHKTITL